jgi:hypothetical protein
MSDELTITGGASMETMRSPRYTTQVTVGETAGRTIMESPMYQMEIGEGVTLFEGGQSSQPVLQATISSGAELSETITFHPEEIEIPTITQPSPQSGQQATQETGELSSFWLDVERRYQLTRREAPGIIWGMKFATSLGLGAVMKGLNIFQKATGLDVIAGATAGELGLSETIISGALWIGSVISIGGERASQWLYRAGVETAEALSRWVEQLYSEE